MSHSPTSSSCFHHQRLNSHFLLNWAIRAQHGSAYPAGWLSSLRLKGELTGRETTEVSNRGRRLGSYQEKADAHGSR